MLTMLPEQIFKVDNIISNRYKIEDVLGQGGMGIVLKVKDLALGGETVALKVLFGVNDDGDLELDRFRNEVVLARRLFHPKIVRIFDIGFEEHTYFTMEYVEGSTIKNYIGEETEHSDMTLIIIQVLQALSYAHEKGVIHRDLKPENILADRMMNIKITDLGLSCATDRTKKFTKTGETVGTPYYMSPELLFGEEVDNRTDLYSLGIIAYELATSQKPFHSDNYLELAHMHMSKAIEDVSVINPFMPKWYAEFIKICTEKKRENRFETADEALQYLYGKVDPFLAEVVIESSYSLRRTGLL